MSYTHSYYIIFNWQRWLWVFDSYFSAEDKTFLSLGSDNTHCHNYPPNEVTSLVWVGEVRPTWFPSSHKFHHLGGWRAIKVCEKQIGVKYWQDVMLYWCKPLNSTDIFMVLYLKHLDQYKAALMGSTLGNLQEKLSFLLAWYIGKHFFFLPYLLLYLYIHWQNVPTFDCKLTVESNYAQNCRLTHSKLLFSFLTLEYLKILRNLCDCWKDVHI